MVAVTGWACHSPARSFKRKSSKISLIEQPTTHSSIQYPDSYSHG